MFYYKIVLLLTLSATLANAEQHHEAKELFMDAKCLRCHNVNDFNARKEKIDTFTKLNAQVKACATNTHAGWFEEESHSVSRYLNHSYYHFPQPAALED